MTMGECSAYSSLQADSKVKSYISLTMYHCIGLYVRINQWGIVLSLNVRRGFNPDHSTVMGTSAVVQKKESK